MANQVQQLPIYDHLTAILQLIGENPASTVVAPTGTGKSIGIPWALGSIGSRVFVAVPTITAAKSLANYQKTLSTNIKVGYAAEGKVNYDNTTKIIYATAGHIRRKMLSYIKDQQCRPMNFTDILMVDEAHTGAIDVTVIKSLWGLCLNSGKNIPRLLLSSATLSSAQQMGKVYKIDLNHRPIEIRYHNKVYNINDPRLIDDTVKIIIRYHRDSAVKGNFLVFASGRSDIENIIRQLGSLENALILPAYGELSGDAIKQIYLPAESGVRKIIIATNIAETAITIQDIGVVIDTLVEKLAEASEAGGLRLNSVFISKSSAKQRCGRTGRTMNGICYRMTTLKFYNTLKEQRKNELERIPIYNLIIEFLNVGLHPGKIFPNISKRAKDATKLLKRLGMVNEYNKITEIGKFAVNFPLGVRNAVIIWKWKEKKLPLFPSIVIATLIDSYQPPYMSYPRRKEDELPFDYQIRMEAHREKYFEKFEGESDVATMLNWWHDLMDYIGGPMAPISDVKEWAVANSFDFRKLREVFNIINQSISTLKRLKFKFKIGPFTTEGALKELKPIISEVYSDLIVEHVGGTNYVNMLTNIQYRLDTKRSVSKLVRYPPGKLAAMVTFTVHKNLNLINVGLDLSGPIEEQTKQRKTFESDIKSIDTLLEQ